MSLPLRLTTTGQIHDATAGSQNIFSVVFALSPFPEKNESGTFA
jgi:hypothetical protein